MVRRENLSEYIDARLAIPVVALSKIRNNGLTIPNGTKMYAKEIVTLYVDYDSSYAEIITLNDEKQVTLIKVPLYQIALDFNGNKMPAIIDRYLMNSIQISEKEIKSSVNLEDYKVITDVSKNVYMIKSDIEGLTPALEFFEFLQKDLEKPILFMSELLQKYNITLDDTDTPLVIYGFKLVNKTRKTYRDMRGFIDTFDTIG